MQEPWIRSLGWTIPWRRKWHPTSVFLLGKPHGQRSLAGYIGHGVPRSWTEPSMRMFSCTLYALPLALIYITKHFCFIWMTSLILIFLTMHGNWVRINMKQTRLNSSGSLMWMNSESSYSLRCRAHFGSFPWWLGVVLKISIAARSCISMRWFYQSRDISWHLGRLTGWHGMSVFQIIWCALLN